MDAAAYHEATRGLSARVLSAADVDREARRFLDLVGQPDA
jgi:hypothetical protein